MKDDAWPLDIDRRPAPAEPVYGEARRDLTCTMKVHGCGYLIVRIHTDASREDGRADFSVSLVTDAEAKAA
jgi:hypothetical protein